MSSTPSRPLIVGTAGHIDHGKSALVLALTGVDPDRLKEEKERGITTDIGFAHLQLPSGATVSFVDVPGHERFVKNMLAGVHGIDAVLLVVAADESVKPQTREHLAICNLLAIGRGIVVLSKCDLVDRDTLGVVRAEVESLTARSFLEGAPMVAVSARTGEGLDELRSCLAELASAPPSRSAEGLLRLPVDRVFTLHGFGTVVTGTLVGGRLRVGDAVLVEPSGRRTRVRGLQVHGQAVDSVSAGNRTAVNLADLGVADIARGDVLVRERTLAATTVLDAQLRLLPGAAPAKSNLRVRVHAASAEILGRIRMLDRASANPGSQALIRLRLERPAVVTRGDRLVLRSYSPAHTIAGAVVLDPLPLRRPRAEVNERPALAVAVTEPAPTFVAALLDEAGPAGIAVEELVARVGLGAAALDAMLSGDPRVVRLEGRWIGRMALGRLAEDALRELDRFHAEAPLRAGMPREELRSRVFPKAGGGAFEAVIQRLTLSGQVRAEADSIRRAGHAVRLSPVEDALKERLKVAARNAGLRGIEIAAVARELSADPSALRRVSRLLVEGGTLKPVGESALVLSEHLEGLKVAVRQRVSPGARLDVGELKEMTGLSRKYAIPLLEFLDRERVTRRTGTTRVLLAPTAERP